MAFVYDLPNAENFALGFKKNSDVANRCTFISGNFFDSVPNADLYLLKVVLHDWDDEHAKTILRNCRKSISRNGKLLIIEKVIEDDKFKDLTCLGDINMLVMLSGKERSIEEFQQLLNETGFILT